MGAGKIISSVGASREPGALGAESESVSHSVVSDSLRPPWTVAHQAPLSMGFSRQEYWSGRSFTSPRALPIPGMEPRSPALQADSLPSEPPGKREGLEMMLYPTPWQDRWERERSRDRRWGGHTSSQGIGPGLSFRAWKLSSFFIHSAYLFP